MNKSPEAKVVDGVIKLTDWQQTQTFTGDWFV